MHIPASSVTDYLNKLPDERKAVIQSILDTLQENLPAGFELAMSYGMPAFVVPHSTYPNGYHCKPEEPLPFISVASQKNFVALYHMGMYAIDEVHQWWVAEYPKHAKRKLDMGKSCVRFKYLEDIPMALIAELARKITVNEWIATYEAALKPSGKKS